MLFIFVLLSYTRTFGHHCVPLWGCVCFSVKPNAFCEDMGMTCYKDQSWNWSRFDLSILCVTTQHNHFMIFSKQACNFKIPERVILMTHKVLFIHFSMVLCTKAPLPHTQFIFSGSKTEHSSPLNPFVSLLSLPLFSPVYMQPLEKDGNKKRVKPPPINPFVFKPRMTYPASCTHILEPTHTAYGCALVWWLYSRATLETAARASLLWVKGAMLLSSLCQSQLLCSCIICTRVPIPGERRRGSMRKHTQAHTRTTDTRGLQG